MRSPIIFRIDVPHHAYLGMCLIGLSFLMIPHSIYGFFDIILGMIGIYFIFDDLIEHTITADTPLRLFFEKIMIPFLKIFSH